MTDNFVKVTEDLLRALIRKQDGFHFSVAQSTRHVGCSAVFDPEDHPYVIGRRGIMVQALQRVVRVMGWRHDLDATLIVLPPGKMKSNPMRFVPNRNWDEPGVTSLLKRVVAMVEPGGSVRRIDQSLMTYYEVGVPRPLFWDLMLIFRAVGKNKGRALDLWEVK